MGSGGSFPIDLILFGMVAAFLVLRLRSILGRRTGFERPPQPVERAVPPVVDAAPVIDGSVEPAAAAAPVVGPDPGSPAGLVLTRMHQIDPSLDGARFLAGAEAAFRLIVTAFAEGNRDGLRPLLNDDTYKAFDSAISAREANGEVQKTEIKSIQAMTIESAELRGNVGVITVRFVSDQVNITLGREGKPVAGADAVMEITDVWTFERDLTSPDPTWRLIAARNA